MGRNEGQAVYRALFLADGNEGWVIPLLCTTASPLCLEHAWRGMAWGGMNVQLFSREYRPT
jgi:hypothetical protein